MKPIILGTAGHIDHGKTALIRRITGINTDRLKEEQRRGITIELGFAFLDLPSGLHVGIVDVPGHEKFVKNMVAGATGIDVVAMVIAADEGIMPQTREHMEICTLLGIRHGLVVLTKKDLVDEELMELVQEEVSDFVEGSFLEDQPVVAVSSMTGEGIEALVDALDSVCQKVESRSSSSLFRLPVDRVFTMKGFGTVITGTLVSGRVQTGENIMIYPTKLPSKIRGIQFHNRSVEEAESGMRTAINFQGLDKADVNRGDLLARPGTLKPSFMVDVHLTYLKSMAKALKNRTRVRFHTGTSEILGNVILLDREELSPGDSAPAQIRLDAPVAVVKDDRFVVRSYSPIRTIGGGAVINPIPGKHRRFRGEVVDRLWKLKEGPPEATVSFHTEQSGYEGVSFSDLLLMTNLHEKKLDQLLQEMLSKRQLIQVDKEQRIYVYGSVFEKLKNEIETHLNAYHQKNPLKAGMPREELKSKFPPILSSKLYHLALNQMVKESRIIGEENTIRSAKHAVSLGRDQADIKRKIFDIYRQSGIQPPYFKEVSKDLEINPKHARDVLMLLIDEGKIVKVKDDLFFEKEALENLKEKLTAFIRKNGEITTPQFKEMTGASRKYVIALIEFFDAVNLTIRIGDVRKLRSR